MTAEERVEERKVTAKANFRLTHEILKECQEIATADSNALGTPGFQSFCTALLWDGPSRFGLKDVSPEYICEQVANILAVVAKDELSPSLYFGNISDGHEVFGVALAWSPLLSDCQRKTGFYATVCRGWRHDMSVIWGKLPICHSAAWRWGIQIYISDCYLDGVMHGEAMVDVRKTEEFTSV